MACSLRWVIVLGLAACNERDPASVDAERLMAQLCESAERCACADDIADHDCVTHRRHLWDERIEEGRRRNLSYDLECFEAQVETAIEYGCWGAAKFEPHLCESFCAVFHGSKELGEECDGFDEVVSNCAQGLVCAEGRCVAPCERLTGLAAGELCMTEEGEVTEQCATGLQCQYESRTCVVLPEIGHACTDNCAYGAYCNWQTYVCEPLRVEGEDCTNTQCAPEFFCDYTTYVCRRYATEGESCGGEVYCGSGLGCGFDGVCHGPGGVGESCSGIGCQDGLICDSTIDQCLAAPDEAGALCPFGMCGGGLWCDNAMVPEGVCQPLIATGERCSGHSQCESGYCPAAYCEVRPADGEDCAAVGICQYGLICDGSLCVEAAAAGPAACSYRGW